jgi:hypothetical protein
MAGRRWLEQDLPHRRCGVSRRGGLLRAGGGERRACRHHGDHEAAGDGRLDWAEVPQSYAAAQRDALHCGPLDRGRRPGRPQCRQQQRRLAQVRPAVIVPMPAVGGCCGGVEYGDEGGGVGRSALRILGHPCGHQRPQAFGQRVQGNRLEEMLAEHHLRAVPDEWRPAGEALVERGGGCIDVAGGTGRDAGHLLGCSVRQGACGDGPVTGPRGDAEVGQLADAVAVNEHVVGFVVAVHHSAAVGGGQAQQRALQHDQSGLRGGLALVGQDLAQRDTADQFHDDSRTRR